MKYAFVLLSIVAIWLAIILIIVSLNYQDILLPIVGIIMTVVLFQIGIGGKK